MTEHNAAKPPLLLQCLSCSFVFAYPSLPVVALQEAYEGMVDETYLAEEKGRRRAARFTLPRILRHQLPGSLLEIGAACGFFLEEARRAGWAAQGIEPSSWAVHVADERFGLTLKEGFLHEDSYPKDSFDVTVMQDVVEHLPDPKRTLLALRSFLKAGGLIIIKTPNIACWWAKILGARWWGVNASHLFYFSPKTIRELLRQCGFIVVDLWSPPRSFSFSYWAVRLRPDLPFFGNLLVFISRWRWLGKRPLTINLHDQMEVFARKE